MSEVNAGTAKQDEVKASKTIGTEAAAKLGMTKEVYLSLPVDQRNLKGVKGAIAAAKPAFNKTVAASQFAAHAGTVWNARLAMGRIVNNAVDNGLTLVQFQSELWLLPFAELRAVRAVVNIGKPDKHDATGSGLSTLARVAKVLGGDLVSPDGKHTVTARQIETWSLSSEDAAKLARKVSPRVSKKTGEAIEETVPIKNLVQYVAAGGDDGGKAAIRKMLETTTKPSGKARPKSIKVNADTYAAIVTKAKEKGVTVEALIKSLL